MNSVQSVACKASEVWLTSCSRMDCEHCIAPFTKLTDKLRTYTAHKPSRRVRVWFITFFFDKYTVRRHCIVHVHIDTLYMYTCTRTNVFCTCTINVCVPLMQYCRLGNLHLQKYLIFGSVLFSTRAYQQKFTCVLNR